MFKFIHCAWMGALHVKGHVTFLDELGTVLYEDFYLPYGYVCNLDVMQHPISQDVLVRYLCAKFHRNFVNRGDRSLLESANSRLIKFKNNKIRIFTDGQLLEKSKSSL